MKKSAFELQARTWREKALSISRHYGADKDEAEDIAQDVMLRLWQMHDELERYQSIEAIVTLMAKHLLRNRQRRRPSETLDAAIIGLLAINTAITVKINCFAFISLGFLDYYSVVSIFPRLLAQWLRVLEGSA